MIGGNNDGAWSVEEMVSLMFLKEIKNMADEKEVISIRSRKQVDYRQLNRGDWRPADGEYRSGHRRKVIKVLLPGGMIVHGWYLIHSLLFPMTVKVPRPVGRVCQSRR